MCGRFALWSDNNRLLSLYGLAAAPEFNRMLLPRSLEEPG